MPRPASTPKASSPRCSRRSGRICAARPSGSPERPSQQVVPMPRSGGASCFWGRLSHKARPAGKAARMTPRQRADLLLVARGLFESRAKAQAAIAAGSVTAGGAPVRKPSDAIAADASIAAAPAFRWVSRGGVKLAHALDRLAFDVTGEVCLDVGASTGGFTEVLIER